jgi:hypothetical protein
MDPRTGTIDMDLIATGRSASGRSRILSLANEAKYEDECTTNQQQDTHKLKLLCLRFLWILIRTCVFVGWLLVVGCWLLVVGCWLLVVGCCLLFVVCWLFVGCCCRAILENNRGASMKMDRLHGVLSKQRYRDNNPSSDPLHARNHQPCCGTTLVIWM